MSAHTPGPWRLEIYEDLNGDQIHRVVGADGRTVCDNKEIYPQAVSEGDARLIAAAPKTAAERDRLKEVGAQLLAALKEIVKCERRRAADLRHREAHRLVAFSEARIAAAEAAIEKAEAL